MSHRSRKEITIKRTISTNLRSNEGRRQKSFSANIFFNVFGSPEHVFNKGAVSFCISSVLTKSLKFLGINCQQKMPARTQSRRIRGTPSPEFPYLGKRIYPYLGYWVPFGYWVPLEKKKIKHPFSREIFTRLRPQNTPFVEKMGIRICEPLCIRVGGGGAVIY